MELELIFTAAAAEFGFSPQLLMAMGWVESRLKEPNIMQITDRTWTECGAGGDKSNPEDNVRGAARYLKRLKDHYLVEAQGLDRICGTCKILWVIVGYNWGPMNVLNHLAAGGGFLDLPDIRLRYLLDVLKQTLDPSPLLLRKLRGGVSGELHYGSVSHQEGEGADFDANVDWAWLDEVESD